MGRKAMETTLINNNVFSLGTAKEHTMQWWFKKFCKGVESLEYEEPRGWPSEADNKLRRSSKLIRLQLHKKSPKNSVSTILQLFAT